MTVTVVDNASGDGTAEYAAAEHPWVTVLPQLENLGFGAATNIGIRRGSNPYVLALNPDAALEADTLPVLLELMENDPLIGCSGPALFQEDGTFDHAARRGFPTPLSSLGHFTGIADRVESGPLAGYRAPEVERGPVDAVNGAFMLLRRRALDQVGLFDEEYWMYMEDLDLNWRLARGGWITFYEPAVRAIHTKGGTTDGAGARSSSSPSTGAWAASTASTTPPITRRRSTPSSTPGSAPGWRCGSRPVRSGADSPLRRPRRRPAP